MRTARDGLRRGLNIGETALTQHGRAEDHPAPFTGNDHRFTFGKPSGIHLRTFVEMSPNCFVTSSGQFHYGFVSEVLRDRFSDMWRIFGAVDKCLPSTAKVNAWPSSFVARLIVASA